MINKKLLSLGIAAGLFMGTAQATMAADVDVDASIITKAAISLTKNTDMDFGDVEYDAVHGGSIQLGTDGAVVLTGATGLTLGAAATTAADVDVSGDGASVVEITCDTGGTLTDGGANTLTLSAVEFTTAAGGAPGTGTACAGVGTSPATVDLSVTATPTILMGGTLDTTADPIDVSATYDTASAGGDPVTLRVVYQ